MSNRELSQEELMNVRAGMPVGAVSATEVESGVT
jgi:hypothetical protein